MKDQIANRLNLNIGRVRNLIDVYENHLAGPGQGRRSHSSTDVLRAATVLLHAALEDVLRTLAYWKLPAANAVALDGIPLVSAAPAMKYTLGALAAHRGQSVDQVIAASVNAYLEQSNYNNTNEISKLLASIGVDVAKVNGQFSSLDELMRRRHQIVHRADRDETGGSGNHQVRSIGRSKVRAWVEAVEEFCTATLLEVPQ